MKCSTFVASVLMMAAASTAQAADCKPFGGVGNGVTEGTATLGSECSARQMGCK